MNTPPADIHSFLAAAGARFLSFGPASDAPDAPPAVELVETFDEYHAEYAAIRKSVGLFDQPQRGLLELTGKDRAEFLHRMITNDTRTLEAGQARRGFLLTKQGRIAADMIVMQSADRMLVSIDRLTAGPTAKELDKYLFSEDVRITDRSEAFHHIALHGPGGAALLSHLTGSEVKPPENLRHLEITLDGVTCTVLRHDEAGAPGLQVILPRESALNVLMRMADAVGGLVPEIGHADGVMTGRHAVHGRGIGWLAYNTARIEAGTPLHHIDFGPDSLPGETGLLDAAVSFTKGCYLGQEIVARMKHLGHPKRITVGLRFEDDRLPVAGSPVHDADSAGGAVIGGITSSTISPLLGNVAIALASMKWGRHTPGTKVRTPAEGAFVQGVVCEWPFVR